MEGASEFYLVAMNTISREGGDEPAIANAHRPVLVKYERYGVPNSLNKDPGFQSLVARNRICSTTNSAEAVVHMPDCYSSRAEIRVHRLLPEA